MFFRSSGQNAAFTGGIVCYNYAVQNGGGICLSIGTATIKNNVNYNGAGSYGGGAYAVDETVVNLEDCSFIGNAAASSGGAIYLKLRNSLESTAAVWNVKGSIYMPSSGAKQNDIKLNGSGGSTTFLSVAGKLGGSGIVATITPYMYLAAYGPVLKLASGVTDVSPTYVSQAADRIAVTPDTSQNWRIDSAGNLKETLGTKPKPDSVGDVVFNDGSAIHYKSSLELTADQKAGAMAVIYYKGTGLNDGGNTVKERMLGLGFAKATSKKWCLNNASAYNLFIEDIHCQQDSSKKNVFTGDKCGKDNLEKISQYLNNGFFDDTSDPSKYPAFYWAKNYKDAANSHIIAGSEFETGWYLPSVAELYYIFEQYKNNSSLIYKVFPWAGYEQLGQSYYFVSSNNSNGFKTGTTDRPFCYCVYMYSGMVSSNDKNNSSYYVCAIREF